MAGAGELISVMAGLVDALRGLDLVAGRMYSVGLDFVLAGPVSMWLQGFRGSQPEPLYLVLVSDTPENRELAVRAARPLSVEAPWPEEYSAVRQGRVVSVEIRGGLHLAVAADPVVDVGGGQRRLLAREVARIAGVAVVGWRPVRLAPISVELALRGETG